MAEGLPAPFRGDPRIPHVSEDFFKHVIWAANLATAFLHIPGKVLGSEVRPRRYNRDYMIAKCDEAAQLRDLSRGQVPKTWYWAPEPTNKSWEKMWHRHLHWKRWKVEREGPAFPTL